MHTHTLLIADDSITTQRVIQLTFADETIRVVVAADGHQALDQIEAERPDIILACTSVPGVDGYAIARHVSRQRHLRKIPVLLLVNGFESHDEQKIKASRARGVLQKPLDPGVVISSVKHELSILALAAERASVEPKPRKARPSSPRPQSARRRSAVPTAGAVSRRAPKFNARQKPAARRTQRGKGLPEFDAINPEALADMSDAIGQVVGQAIAHAISHAIAGYQRPHGLAPEPAIEVNLGSVVSDAANDLRSRSPQSPMIVHGDSTLLNQLRRDMGVDDFVFDEASLRVAVPDVPVSSSTPSVAPLQSAAATELEPSDVLSDWSEDIQWLAAEIKTARVAPKTGAPASSRDFSGLNSPPPQALPARLGAWLAACDITPGIGTFGAATIAWLRSGTAQLFEPLRGGEVRVRTWAAWLAGDLRRS